VSLSDAEREQYGWQFPVEGFGESGQRKLKASSVLVSRAGGVGGSAAWQLAAAGVGRIVLAHAGNLAPSDLNRQTLMEHAGIGSPRVEQAAARLRAFNPHIQIEAVPENISDANALRIVGDVDLVVDAAPLFEERYAMNRAAVRLGKPMVEAAMFGMEGYCTTFLPGAGSCLACLFPEKPPDWKRQFPVFGALSATIGSIAAMEAIKVLAGFGKPLADRLLVLDLGTGTSRTLKTRRDPRCPVCGRPGPACAG
jgi:molybdopterin/thiamine biosynthesis adenylyltransferase